MGTEDGVVVKDSCLKRDNEGGRDGCCHRPGSCHVEPPGDLDTLTRVEAEAREKASQRSWLLSRVVKEKRTFVR